MNEPTYLFELDQTVMLPDGSAGVITARAEYINNPLPEHQIDHGAIWWGEDDLTAIKIIAREVAA